VATNRPPRLRRNRSGQVPIQPPIEIDFQDSDIIGPLEETSVIVSTQQEIFVPPPPRAVSINEQDLLILMEGPGNSPEEAIRNVCIGLASGALITTINMYCNFDADIPIPPKKFFALALIGAIFFATSAVALYSHFRAKSDRNRQSYKKLISRLKGSLEDSIE
jgi:hypothetical protein